jgi:serine/threonine protein kinase
VAALILKGVAESLLELHRHDYVHRDLKLENIMIENKDSFNVKLVDFGFAEKVNYSQLVSKAGTPGYIPPEIFKNQPYTAKGDIFSLGVIMYSLILGDSPFKAPNYQIILEENKKSNIDFSKPFWNEISAECKLILKKMCEVKPEQRATALEILESTWVTHHTKASSEMTYYQSYSQRPVSNIEYEKKPNSSSRSIRQEDEDKSFEF